MSIARIAEFSVADRAKWCHVARRVPYDAVKGLDATTAAVEAGDLLLVEVDRLGQHRRAQLRDGRHSRLFTGDLLVLAAGDRFAADQFTGRAGVHRDGRLDLLAGGGVAGILEARSDKVGAPTRLHLRGRLLSAERRPLRLDDFALTKVPPARPGVVFAVLGSGMNAGKTEAAASLVKGLSRLGYRVGAIKVTGTAAFGDTHLYADAGAASVLDFTDAGMGSTFRQSVARIEEAMSCLLAETARRGCDVAVMEFADGIGQVETEALIARPAMRAAADAVIFAAADPLSAEAGCARLSARDLSPTALTGVITRNPTALPEDLQLPVLCRDTLMDPASAAALVSRVEQRRAVA